MEISFNQFNNDIEGTAGWRYVEEATGSDYSGSSYTRANFEWLRDNYGDHPDIMILWGHFFGYGIGFNQETEDDTLRAIIDGLEDYVIICEHKLAQVEERWISEALDSYIFDFKREIRRVHGEEMLEEVLDETIGQIFEICRELSNTEWIPENCGMYIDVDRLVPHFEEAVSRLPVHV